MSNDFSFAPPEITDDDIRWASGRLNLKRDAFFGNNGRDPRQDVLKSMKSLDVAACPGSGKTTILVAKLAILAEKWPHHMRGICVLSHTNAARTEIETKLGNTTAGRGLLSYPHFIGTIHGFVNEFLATPWLRSKENPIRLIDDDRVESRRRYLLRHDRQFSTLMTYVRNNEKRQNVVGQWTISSPDFLVVGKDGEPVFKNDCASKGQLRLLAQTISKQGYHRYDEMFMWAHDLMDKEPNVVETIRNRFPLLFIDEAQDNNKAQSAILDRIFMPEKGPVIRQRFGDSNQAIYNFAGDAGADDFPDKKIMVVDLPNSHRFGQTIADLADPLGVEPCGLKGQGPKDVLASGARDGHHTTFLFRPDDVGKVLDAYGKLLFETFSDEELRKGRFWAVGLVHQPPEKEDPHKFPHHIGHYWSDYDPDVAKADPQPETFVQYVLAGMARAETTGEAFHAAEKIAEGILRLAGMVEGGKHLQQRKHNNRYVFQLLEGDTEGHKSYGAILESFVLKKETPSKETWNRTWRQNVINVVQKVAKTQVKNNTEVQSFLSWPEQTNAPALATAQKRRGNLYRYAENGREVVIQVGSIHSVKGKTTTAMLVVETFWHEHNLEKLQQWMVDSEVKKGWKTLDGVQQKTRLKIHYVAMTRPTHLLCLAMKRSTFEKDDTLDQAVLKKLEQRDWKIKCL